MGSIVLYLLRYLSPFGNHAPKSQNDLSPNQQILSDSSEALSARIGFSIFEFLWVYKILMGLKSKIFPCLSSVPAPHSLGLQPCFQPFHSFPGKCSKAWPGSQMWRENGKRWDRFPHSLELLLPTAPSSAMSISSSRLLLL